MRGCSRKASSPPCAPLARPRQALSVIRAPARHDDEGDPEPPSASSGPTQAATPAPIQAEARDSAAKDAEDDGQRLDERRQHQPSRSVLSPISATAYGATWRRKTLPLTRICTEGTGRINCRNVAVSIPRAPVPARCNRSPSTGVWAVRRPDKKLDRGRAGTMVPRHLQHAVPPKEPFAPIDAGHDRDVRLRPDGLRPRSYRQRAPVRHLDVAPRNWLKRGYDATSSRTSPTSTTRSTRPPQQARSAELAEHAHRRAYKRTRTTSGSGARTPSRRPPRRSTGSIAMIEELIGRGLAYAVDGDVYFRVVRFQRVRAAVRASVPTRSRSRSRTRSRRTPGFCAVEGEQAWRGHLVGVTVGARPARLAHRVLGHGREVPRRGVRDPRRRPRPRLPPPRERACAVRGLGRPFARIWMHNGMLGFGGEEMHKSLGNDVSLRNVLDTWGRETVLLYFPARSLAQADRLLRRRDGSGEG